MQTMGANPSREVVGETVFVNNVSATGYKLAHDVHSSYLQLLIATKQEINTVQWMDRLQIISPPLVAA